jgi:hypothetical protein
MWRLNRTRSVLSAGPLARGRALHPATSAAVVAVRNSRRERPEGKPLNLGRSLSSELLDLDLGLTDRVVESREIGHWEESALLVSNGVGARRTRTLPACRYATSPPRIRRTPIRNEPA